MAAYDAKDRTLKDITHSTVHVSLFSNHTFRVLDISSWTSYLLVFSISNSPCYLPAYFPTQKGGEKGF